ncbi:MAG TPA: MBL fold metallo-hydrolase [Clostridiaceae bacterium]|nr:MBL fold metallo-hydrolase [Clostridiaceae bacterium]
MGKDELVSQEIYPGIHMAAVPLPRNPLRSINNYIIKGMERDVMVDTAFHMPSCMEHIEDHMLHCHTEPQRLDIFLTHLHSDHTGLASVLAARGATLRMGAHDAAYVNNSVEADSPIWLGHLDLALQQGLHEDHLELCEHPGFRFRPLTPLVVETTVEDEIIECGSMNLQVIDLPGHTPGLQALYEPDHQLLFCGDHILGDITPNITFWDFSFSDSLGAYFESLTKIRRLPVRHLFSAHRNLVEDVEARIDALFAHHHSRLQETRDCLRRYGAATVRTVTQNLHWDIRAKNWMEFPNAQKWFAAGEAMAHLEHLVASGQVTRHTSDDGVFYYELV